VVAVGVEAQLGEAAAHHGAKAALVDHQPSPEGVVRLLTQETRETRGERGRERHERAARCQQRFARWPRRPSYKSCVQTSENIRDPRDQRCCVWCNATDFGDTRRFFSSRFHPSRDIGEGRDINE
jgi:hypothetical protein